MEVSEYRAGAEEKHQLEYGVVHHMQQRAPGSQRVLLAQKAEHADARENKPDLGHGGAGQRTLEVNAEQGQHRTEEHGDAAQQENYRAPGRIVPEEIAGNRQDAPDAGFGQGAGEQG